MKHNRDSAKIIDWTIINNEWKRKGKIKNYLVILILITQFEFLSLLAECYRETYVLF